MDTSVILGAAIMLIGVASGFGFSFLAGEARDRKNRRLSVVSNNMENPHPLKDQKDDMTSHEIRSRALTIGSSLSSVRTALAAHASKPIPVDVGDDIDDVVTEVIDHANVIQNLVPDAKLSA